MRKFIKFFGSLSFALWLIGGLAVILIASTLLESAHGTPFVQRFFYQAGWFDVFLALFGLNILCSSLSRWPYKKYHTGFLVVHTGILLLLAGSLLARYQGVDGQIALYEGEKGERILLPGYELMLHQPDHGVKIIPLDKANQLKQEHIASLEANTKIFIKKAIAPAEMSEDIHEGDGKSPKNAGITFRIKSAMAGADQSVSLFQHHPDNPEAHILSMGAATFEILDSPPIQPKSADDILSKPRLTITQKDSGKSFSWDLQPLPTGDLKLGDTGILIKNLRYFPDARVNDKQELVNVSEQALNPTVEFEAVDKNGNHELHTRFELFPDFESLHGKTKNDILHLQITLETPDVRKAKNKKPTGIQFYIKNGQWTYHTHSSKSEDQEGVIEIGKEYSAGWMDFRFIVEKVYTRAQITRQVGEVKSGSNHDKIDMAVLISIDNPTTSSSEAWLLPGDNLRLDTSKGPLIIALRQRSAPIPFALTLKDFRKVDYPGTTEALSYESDVLLEDAKDKIKIEKTISMNKPLDYKGYRIFQSSFSQDPQAGETSVFTVAKNPGIFLIYLGSIVMSLGIIIVFYIKPLSSFSGRGNANVS